MVTKTYRHAPRPLGTQVQAMLAVKVFCWEDAFAARVAAARADELKHGLALASLGALSAWAFGSSLLSSEVTHSIRDTSSLAGALSGLGAAFDTPFYLTKNGQVC